MIRFRFKVPIKSFAKGNFNFFKFSIFCQFFCGNQIELLFVAMIVVAVVVIVAVVIVLDVAAVVVLDVAAVIIVLMTVSSSFQGHL